MTTERNVYKILRQGDMKYIAMPKDATGYYLRRGCQDGAVMFLPVTVQEPPKPKTAEELWKLKEELIDQKKHP